MLTRRMFLSAMCIPLMLDGCSRKVSIGKLTGNIGTDALVMKEKGITRITTGVVSLNTYIFLQQSLGEDKIVSVNEQDLFTHARLVKKNIKSLLSRNFIIVKSEYHNDRINQSKKNTASIDWDLMNTLVGELIDIENSKLATRNISLIKELFANDYIFIEKAG